MHIVFGGAFNGKRDFVKEQLGNQVYSWYENVLPEPGSSLVVVAGIEQWLKTELEKGRTETEIVKAVLKASEKLEGTAQIWILTDISRGLVPVEPVERQWRDAAGRLYQQLFKNAERITRIWYGLPQTIKGGEENENLHENGR